jgi:Uma2 family endonuclease
MNVLAKPRMSVDEFLAWVEGRPGRYEIHRGKVVARSPESVGHAEIKGEICFALHTAIHKRKLPCHALLGDMMVRIDERTAYIPDTQVYCAEKLKGTALEIPNPLIVVEVLSPSTQHIDVVQKLAGYFRVPSVAHYLIVDPMQPTVIHHARGTGDTIATRVVTEGSIVLDPPGIALSLAEIYPAD